MTPVAVSRWTAQATRMLVVSPTPPISLSLSHFSRTSENSTENAFVAKINSTGTALVYSTYLGGKTGNDITSSSGIAVDNTGRAYVTGTTNAVDFPVKNAYQSASAGGIDAFITVFSPTGNTLIYSTYLGGSGGGFGIGIALDSSQNAYITGASGVGFPTLHSVQPQGNVFVAKFNKAGTLQYSSVIGDSPISNGLPTNVAAIAVDTEGSAYITGSTNSQSFPIRNPAFQSKCLACPGRKRIRHQVRSLRSQFGLFHISWRPSDQQW